MIRRLIVMFGLALLPALAGCPRDRAPAAAGGAATSPDAEAEALILEGQRLARAGNWREAIDQGFDPAIALFEKTYGGTDRQVLCTRGSSIDSLGLLFGAAIGLDPNGPPDLETFAATPRETIVLDSPAWPDALYFKAFALSELGDLPAARAAIERAMALMPGDLLYMAEFGDQAQRMKNWTEALAMFTDVKTAADRLAADPNGASRTPNGAPPVMWQTRARRGMGYSLIEMGRLDEAEAVYREALALDPTDEQSRTELAYIAALRAKAAP